MNTAVRSDLFDVARRLRELGLKHDMLVNPVHAAYQAWSNCTPLDPRMYPGLTLWAVAVRHLRMGLIPFGWSANDDGNYSLTVSPNNEFAIAVATGDEFTGLPDKVPSTRSRKGPRTVEAVAANNRQLGLDLVFPEGLEPPVLDPSKFGKCATWLLLMHREDDLIRIELSHPLGFDEDQHVTGWKERIILTDIGIGPLDSEQLDEEEAPIDVPVSRRI